MFYSIVKTSVGWAVINWTSKRVIESFTRRDHALLLARALN